MRYFGKRAKYLILFIPIILLLVITVPVMAVAYYANILVQETAGVNHGTIGLISSMNMTFMADNGFINSDGRDVQLMWGGTATHRMLAEDKLLFIDDVTPYQSDYYSFTTNNTPEDFSIITGYGGYITVADDADLEPGNDFTDNITAYIDTSKLGEIIIDKPNSYFVSTDTVTAGKVNFTVDNYEDFTTYTEQDAGGFISETADTITVTNCNSVSSTYAYKDYGVGFITDVDLTFVINVVNDPQDSGYGGIAVANAIGDITGFGATDISVVGRWGGANVAIFLTRGNGFGVLDSVNGLSANTNYYIRSVKDFGNDNAFCYIYSDADMTVLVDTLSIAGCGVATTWRYYYGFVNYKSGAAGREFSGTISKLSLGEDVSLSLSGISSGLHSILPSLSGGTASLTIGASSNSTAYAGSIYNSSSNFTIGSTATPYIDSVIMTRGGVRELYFEPNEIIIGDTLPDREPTGGDNDGTIHWGSNPAGVNLQNGYLQFDRSVSTGQTIGVPDSVDILNAPDNMSHQDSDMTMAYNVFYFLVKWLSDITGIDVVMIWWWLSAALSIATLVLVRRLLNNIWLAGLCAAIISAAFVAMGTTTGTAGALEFWIPVVIVIATAFVGIWLKTSEAG